LASGRGSGEGQVHAPKGAVTLGELLAPLGCWKKDDHPTEIVRQWSSEALYHLLAKNRERVDLCAFDSNAGSPVKTSRRQWEPHTRQETTQMKMRFARGIRA
jgi:hypothetical protein